MPNTLEALRREAEQKPGVESWFRLAKAVQEINRPEARELCFKIITQNPTHKLARLLLAQLFYLDSMFKFSARELVELSALVDSPSLTRLISEFGSLADAVYSANLEEDADSTVAELDISFDNEFLDLEDKLRR